jgi:hypothetical protein
MNISKSYLSENYLLFPPSPFPIQKICFPFDWRQSLKPQTHLFFRELLSFTLSEGPIQDASSTKSNNPFSLRPNPPPPLVLEEHSAQIFQQKTTFPVSISSDPIPREQQHSIPPPSSSGNCSSSLIPPKSSISPSIPSNLPPSIPQRSKSALRAPTQLARNIRPESIVNKANNVQNEVINNFGNNQCKINIFPKRN